MRISDWSSDVCSSDLEALKAGGRLLIDTMNYPSYVRNFQPSNVIEHNGDLVVDRQRLDPLTSRSIATRTVLRDGAVRQEPSASRVHTFPELRDWLRAAGFANVTGSGEDGAAPPAEHRRQRVRSEENTSELQSLMR